MVTDKSGIMQPVLVGNTDKEFVFSNGTGGNSTCEYLFPGLPKNLNAEQLSEVATAIAFTCPARQAARYR